MTKDEPQRRCVQAYRVWDQLGQAWTIWWFAFKAAYGYLEGDLVARKELETLRIRHNESYNTFLTRYEGLVARLDDRLPEPELCFQFLRRCPLRLAEKIGKRGLNRNWQGIKDLVIDLTKAAQSKAIAKAAQDFAPISQPVRSSPSSSTQATNNNQGRPRFPQPATPSFNRFGNNGYRPPVRPAAPPIPPRVNFQPAQAARAPAPTFNRPPVPGPPSFGSTMINQAPARDPNAMDLDSVQGPVSGPRRRAPLTCDTC
ncbi:hypothetical protein DFQ26_002117, partial [Actinomortierella ambigua]